MKSFSSTDIKGVEVKGKVVYDSSDSTWCLVQEDVHPPLPPVLWIVDKLEDVGVSFDVDQLREALPQLYTWAALQPPEIPNGWQSCGVDSDNPRKVTWIFKTPEQANDFVNQFAKR